MKLAKHHPNKNDGNKLDFTSKLRKLWNMKVTVILIVSRKLGTVHEDWEKGLEDHLKYSIGEIVQNSERSPGDKRTLIFAQTPVKI